MDDITMQKIKRIYGLLWNAKTDRDTLTGVAVSEARKIALSMIDKNGQVEGIEWANREIIDVHKTVKMA